MPAPGSHDSLPLVTVLYIGPEPGALADRLREHRIGVIAVQRLDRCLRLLGNFRVAAVICDMPDLQTVAALAETQTRVIVLAAADAESMTPAIVIVNRRTPAHAIAEIVRRAAAERSDRARDAA
jgi:hypothetical protein